MKVFWSWQSDTDGKIGRHFVRKTLEDAIETLRKPPEIEEPPDREVRDALHLDHDRQGVTGSPDLAATIFGKIEQASVFIADVTLVGEAMRVNGIADTATTKKFINSNVAIEFGFAQRALGNERILMVQNRHFGERDALPFDLRHKAGPISYSLAPGATKTEIASERARLKGELVNALRPIFSMPAPSAPRFQEHQPPDPSNPALFALRDEVLARYLSTDGMEIKYQFLERKVFYLRLIPIKALPNPLKIADLHSLVKTGKFGVLSKLVTPVMPSYNGFGVVAYQPQPQYSLGRISRNLELLTQVFRSGEIWGIGASFFPKHNEETEIATDDIAKQLKRVLKNYCDVAQSNLGVDPPYNIKLGATGLKESYVRYNFMNRFDGQIQTDILLKEKCINSVNDETLNNIVESFLDDLYDLGGLTRSRS